MIIEGLQLEKANGVNTPGEGDRPWLEEEDQELLRGKETSMFRAVAARANYLAQDGSDIQYATKECAESMSDPKRGDMQRFKRLGRYLVYHGRYAIKFGYQEWARRIVSFGAAFGTC